VDTLNVQAVTINSGADCVASGAGTICHDTTAGQLIVAGKVYDARRSESFTFDSPLAGNMRKFAKPFGMTLTGVTCLTELTTSAVLDVLACNSNGGSCASVLAAPITCGTTKSSVVPTTTLINAGAYMKVSVGTVSGSPSELYVSVDYTVTRE
jgi:hypothetical protein